MVSSLSALYLIVALILSAVVLRQKNRQSLVAFLDLLADPFHPRRRSLDSMAPTIHFVRHAQGYHNLNVANHQLRDPLLTPYGKQQCAHLNKTFPRQEDIDLIVASPLKRTIYTALESFPDVIANKKLVIIALPEVQETSDLPCDTGSDVSELLREFEGQPINFDLVHEGWHSKQGPWAPQAPQIEERCKVARRWLRSRPEKNIVVVTHGGVLHYLTEDWQDLNRFQGTGWANTEFRSYGFDSRKSAHDNASLLETEESRTRRRGTEKPLTESEQRNLKRTSNVNAHGGAHSRNSSSLSNKIPSKIRTMNRLSQTNARDWVGPYGF